MNKWFIAIILLLSCYTTVLAQRKNMRPMSDTDHIEHMTRSVFSDDQYVIFPVSYQGEYREVLMPWLGALSILSQSRGLTYGTFGDYLYHTLLNKDTIELSNKENDMITQYAVSNSVNDRCSFACGNLDSLKDYYFNLNGKYIGTKYDLCVFVCLIRAGYIIYSSNQGFNYIYGVLEEEE